MARARASRAEHRRRVTAASVSTHRPSSFLPCRSPRPPRPRPAATHHHTHTHRECPALNSRRVAGQSRRASGGLRLEGPTPRKRGIAARMAFARQGLGSALRLTSSSTSHVLGGGGACTRYLDRACLLRSMVKSICHRLRWNKYRSEMQSAAGLGFKGEGQNTDRKHGCQRCVAWRWRQARPLMQAAMAQSCEMAACWLALGLAGPATCTQDGTPSAVSAIQPGRGAGESKWIIRERLGSASEEQGTSTRYPLGRS